MSAPGPGSPRLGAAVPRSVDGVGQNRYARPHRNKATFYFPQYAGLHLEELVSLNRDQIDGRLRTGEAVAVGR